MGTTALREKHKGTSAFGGRYAAHERLESAVSLTAGVARAKAEDPLTGAEALSVAKTLAGHALRSSRLPKALVDDIAQDALTSVINSRSRGTVDNLTPGLIASATRMAVSQHLNAINGIRHEEFKARQKLNEQVELRTQDLGRGLTDSELDELASDIRDDWHNPRHKPTVGFHKVFTEVDIEGEGSEAYELPSLVARNDNRGELSHDLADDIEAGRIDKSRARRAAWNAIAGDLGLPEVVVGSITESRARGYVKAIGEAVDGALGIAGRFLDGESDARSTELLFAPFGRIDDRARVVVAEALTSRPQFADRLWRSALDAANARNN